MSEGGEKTELPTPKKQRDAREKGQVARSTEAVTTISLIAIVSYVWLAWGRITAVCVGLFDRMATLATQPFDTAGPQGVVHAFREAALVLLPVLAVAIVAGVAANYVQIGSLFSLQSVAPSLEKISPAAGFKRIFSLKQLVELLKSVLKIVFLSALLFFVVRDAIGPYVNSLDCGLPCQAAVTTSILLKTLSLSAGAFIVVALADFAWQKHSHTKSLMMTKDEVKREYKESEGDPHIKGKRKQLAHELAMGDGGTAARKGSAVVVNPTHFAVVIDYRPGETPLPVVTAKGRNAYAHHIRTEAEKAGVPVFRNVALARALFADAELYEPIPDELFDAVAEVLAWVARHSDRLYAGPLPHGVVDMDGGDHREPAAQRPGSPGRSLPN
ncbi:type III secretion system export apparatus subunit SctU [Aureimonas leprariae]|uniref:EscU/YscU/HrcU family type III secretion system export apparatus switch protein n=1 Tax=Plantimonas leprariae TaxID=2615207 RepID=A0A7V7PL23_9HYPH|nr:type III secretion system export apparatus subunit SctU [Aureimonas leprariae]KAB0676842.1 EscU/YscU/HrcU family type III secretion system export apparatus switch protein [Aureimonas leprariae]